MCRKGFLLIFIFPSVLCALPLLSFQTRYFSQTSAANSVDGTALFKTSLVPLIETELASRFSLSKNDLESFDYKAELYFPLLSFLKLGARYSHQNFLPKTVSLSTLFFHAQLDVFPFQFLHLFSKVGWYKRYALLNKPTILPFPIRNSFSEHDLSGEIGFSLFPNEPFFGALKASTIDAIDVFNLNNPYAELLLGYQIDRDFTVSLFSRYQILLGFGRLDSFMVGFSLQYLIQSTFLRL